MAKVSIIIPNYNHSAFLVERVESVLGQTFQDFELIILDDCSTDNSRDIIEKYKKHPKVSHVIYNEKNSGSTFKQWQKGIELAAGEWIWIAESDDVAAPTFLEKLLKRSDNSGLIYCSSQIINETGEDSVLWGFNVMPDPNLYKEFSTDFEMSGDEFTDMFLIKDNFIPNASAVLFKKDLIRPEIFSKISNKKLLGDWIFWLHVLEKTNILFVSETLNFFRTHQNTVRSISEKNNIQFKEYFSIVDFFNSNKSRKRNALDRIIYLFFETTNILLSDKILFFRLILVNNKVAYFLKSWYFKFKKNILR